MWCAYMYICAVSLIAQLCPTLCDRMDCSPPDSSVHGDSPGKNTRVDCHALLQGIFPTQGSNPGLLHCRGTLHHLSHQRSPYVCVCMYVCVYIYIYIYIYTVEYYSATKKERNNTISFNMGRPRNDHTKWSESERDKCHVISLLCRI